MMISLVWKNSQRKKARFVLTWLSVVVAFLLFTLLAGINHALQASVAGSNQYRLMTSHQISLTRSLPLHYQQKIQALEGVDAVTYASWFGGFYQNEQNPLTLTAVDSEHYFALFPEYQLPPESLTSWQNNRIGMIVGEQVAERYQWQVGDRIPVQSSIWMNKQGSFTWEFVVSGIYQGSDSATDRQQIFFRHDYFDEARAYGRHMTGWFTTQITPGVNVDEISGAIDTLFANSSASTRTTTEQVFIKERTQQFVDMAMVINIVVSAVFFTLLLIVCNTMIQVLRERLNEIAMMKALGFSSTYLIVMVYLESLLLLGLGALAGSLMATLGLARVQQQFAEFLPGISLTSQHYLVVGLLAAGAALICTFFPALTIKRLAISQTLGAKQ